MQKKLVPNPGAPGRPVVFHDPCFLGRYHGLYAPPREILRSIYGTGFLEVENTGPRSFCCGAGGGHFFMDLDGEERPSSLRIHEMIARGAGTTAVSCHFCFAMFDDACRRLPGKVELRVVDWLELLRESVRPPRT